jgi:DNA-binding transcriptional LysR family regulator
MTIADRPYKQLRFRQLEMICEVADTGGIRSAADRLHLSPPAVSKSLREIESTLGFALFERRPRGMALTARGERVVAHARLLLNELGALADESRGMTATAGGSLRLAASAYVSAHVLPPLLSALRTLHQDAAPTRVRIHDGLLGVMLERLLAGEIDALLTLYAVGDLEGSALDLLTIDRLRDEPIVVVAPPALLRPLRRALTWRALAGQPWIMPPEGVHLRRNLDKMFHADGVRPPQPVIESSHLTGNVRLSAAGLGLTAAPLALVQASASAADLWPLRLQQPLPPSSVVMIHRRVSATYLLSVQRLRAAALAAFGPFA